MEEKKPEGRKISLRLKPVFTLERDTRIGASIENVNLYLYKNGAIANCPFRALLAREGIVPFLCGEDCQHFHFVPETKKIPVQPTESDTENKDVVMETVETGKIFVRLTCGCGSGGNGTYLPIANVDTGGAKPEPSPLKVVK